ncbi:uncharacterized protein si:dkey-56e3.3 isoform X2 [Pseudorasbora parva]|uniref:uncharacterized protein si:dkey-56e3.3 isoform X2 n=1 Tax=Pseudorasbora parva TaxID=51549 RepID=UPI00351F5049
MANMLTFQTQIASVMEVLANAAVAEICKLVEDSCAEIQLEISQTKKENNLLKNKLKSIEIRDSFYRRAHKLMNKSTAMTRTSVHGKVSGRISVKVASLCNDGCDEEESVHHDDSLLQPDRLIQSVGGDEPDVLIIKEERPDSNTRCEQPERERETTENHDAQYQSAEVFVTVLGESNIDQNAVQHSHQETVEDNEPDVLIIKEERPDNTRCDQPDGETKTGGNHDTQYRSAGSFVAVHRENFIDQDTVQHCHQESNGMQPDLLEDENPEMFDGGEPSMRKHYDGEAETNPQPVPSYASWVSRRFDTTTSHPSYSESECNGGPSVNQYLMYSGSTDPLCSYVTPIDSEGLSVSNTEGHLTHSNDGNISQSERSPFNPSFSFKQSYSPQMQRKDKFMCKHCGKAFSQPSTLLLHQKIHTRERLHSCTLCGKRFSQASSLKRHHSIHRGEKPFRCLHCGKQFSDQSNLKKHVTVHTGEKPYGCNLCGKMFNQSSNLKTHMKIHTREKPFSCDRCGRMFAHKYILVKHQQRDCVSSGPM